MKFWRNDDLSMNAQTLFATIVVILIFVIGGCLL